MAYVICEPCIGTKDATCTDVCPTDAIHPMRTDPRFGAVDQLFIDPHNCIDCGMCAGVCPVNAIYLKDDVPQPWIEYIQKNADYYGG